MLEVPAGIDDDVAVARWQSRVVAMRERLDWPDAPIVSRRHAAGTTLAFEAPVDQLLTATEVNEWAWLGALASPAPWPTPLAPGDAPLDASLAVPLFAFLGNAESPAGFTELVTRAAAQQVPAFWDDEQFTLGAGYRGLSWPIAALPVPDDVPWQQLGAIPVALVAGSNGKTTTVRLVNAMCEAHGLISGHSCTDGVRVAGESLEQGDWSGPGGARRVLRDHRVEAAVLETARGGILRRGLAVTGARAAIITNVQLDHLGEYGIATHDEIAEVKLVVAKGLAPDGVLVLNADDTRLAAARNTWSGTTAWFSLDEASTGLRWARRTRAPVAFLADTGELLLEADGSTHVIGTVDSLPLAAGGLARYNIANALGAALVAWALGVSSSTIAAVLARFGSGRLDNPGRLMRWTVRGASVFLDYAHNPEGLSGLFDVARAARKPGSRLLVLLGQAGNRDDDAVRALARVVAAERPDVVVVKDLEGFMRGRATGEVPALLADELLRAGMPADALQTILAEADAARALVEMARHGDVVVLPVHGQSARDAVVGHLDTLEATAGTTP